MLKRLKRPTKPAATAADTKAESEGAENLDSRWRSLEERLAFVLALGRLDGHDFDVAAMRWKEAKR